MTRTETIRQIIDRLRLSCFLRRRVSPQTPWQQCYHQPLVDLGTIGGEKLRGIFSPQYKEAIIQRYIHCQFRENAQSYAEKYTAIECFTMLLSDAFTRIGWEEQRSTGLAILDIGSGAGNSIFPLLHLCPKSLVIASDLSLELLMFLKQKLEEQGLGQRCGLLQLNAEELDFAPESFDLVVGVAVLHHLFSPDRTLQGCARILRPGGYSIFFEPFESGNAILNLIFEAILRQSAKEPLVQEAEALLRSLARAYTATKGRDKSSSFYAQAEDKWLFTESYVKEVAEKAGFSECRIYSLHPPEQMFTKQIEEILRLGLGKERQALPQWAWDMIQHYEESFSSDLKKDLLIEAGIILRK